MRYKKTFQPLYEHRPFLTKKFDTKILCDNLEYDYLCSDDFYNIPVDKGTPILVCGAGIIPQEIIQKFTIINSHPGYIPEVRGLDALKWAIIEDKVVGVTTHIIGDEIDAGEIIQRKRVPVYNNDTFHSLAQRVFDYEVMMLVDSLKHYTEEHNYFGAGKSVLHKRMPQNIEKNLMTDFSDYIEKRGIQRLDFDMKNIYPNWDFNIVGISTIDYPIDNTLILITEENSDKIENLKDCEYCVVISDEKVRIDKKIGIYNFFIIDENPKRKFECIVDNAMSK